MYLAMLVLVGGIVGWLAGRGLEGIGYGRTTDFIMGAGGAVVGGLVIRGVGFTGNGGTVFATFAAVCCAALLTIAVGLANGKTIYSRAIWGNRD
jgi:uncharacterized membrane protein YeaQ/YmgE (transglycosylase-associated protein family)